MKLGNLLKTYEGTNWIIPRYNEYMRERDLEGEAYHAKKILSRPQRDRAVGWSSSAAGGCLRAQQYNHMRTPKTEPPNDKTMNIFSNGDYVHLRHQVFGLVAGYLTEVEVPVLVEMGDHPRLGTMDATTSADEGAEYKSINSYGYSSVRQFGPKQDHLYQVNAYMALSGLQSFRIVYECKNTQDLTEFQVYPDDAIRAEIIRSWERLDEAVDQKVMLPVLPECKKGEGRIKWCPYASKCMSDHANTKSRIRLTSSSVSD